MDRLALAFLVVGALFPLMGQAVLPRPDKFTSGPVPALPYYDWGACPGEGCIYARWTALKPVAVFDTFERKRRLVTRLSAGDNVFGVTGVVVTHRPGVIRMDRDLPIQQLMRGDTILTYTYRGESESAVWLQGRYYPNFDIGYTRWPDGTGCGGEYCAATYVDIGRKTWWAEVKLKSGRTGWVDMDDAEFDGTCSLADPRP